MTTTTENIVMPQVHERARMPIFTLCLLLLAASAPAVDFYVDSSIGNDGNPGTSAQPWRSLSPANSRAFAPGDRLLLTSGQTFSGPLWLDSGDVGTAAAPITVSATGAAAATITVTGDQPGISVYNAGGFAISNLTVVGPWSRSAQTANSSTGIGFYCDQLNQRKPYVRIDQVDVSGFRSGISLGGSNGVCGFTDIRITRSRCHHNQRAGLNTYSNSRYGVTNVYIGHCTFDNNTGDPAMTTNSGSGLVLGCVDSAVVERSVAHNNGVDCFANEGPCGFWAYDSNNVIFQDNESYSNKSSGVADGDGFDLDGACTNCVMQRNYAHDNDAAGFLCWQYAGAATWSGNIIRYNISQNDCRRLPYGAIHVGTSGPSIGGAEIHHNTIFLSGGATGISGICFATATTGFKVYDNIIVTTGGIPLTSVSNGQSNLLFNGNDYWSSGAAFIMSWANTSYSSLSAWRSASGQEPSGGFAVDPQLMNAGGGGIIGNSDNLASLTAYQLRATSPLINRGVSLGVIPLGPSDFYGTSVPQGGACDVGAHESVATATVPAPTVASASPSSGPTAGGTTITISGSGFSLGATVSLGGSAATGVNVVSSTSITCVTPARTAGAVAVSVTCNGQTGTLASGFTFVTPTVPGALPAGWTNRDIGAVGLPGSTTYNNATFTVNGSGADIAGTVDAFQFAAQPLIGDGTIVARVVSEQNTDPWAKAGVMIRQSDTAGAKYAFSFVTPGNGVGFQRRTSAGGSTATTAGSRSTAPRWLKLVRIGKRISSYESADGATWTLVGSTSIGLSSPAQIGLAVTSHNNGVLCTTVFDNVVVTP